MRNTIARNGFVVGKALVLAAAFMMTMPMHVSAQPGSRGFGGPQGGGRGGMLPGLRGLDLTDAQRDEIRSVR